MYGFTGTLVHYQQPGRERVAGPRRRRRLACAGTPVRHSYEKQSGNECYS